MHDRIRLALSAAGIALVTLAASGAPIPFLKAHAPAERAPIAAIVVEAPKATAQLRTAAAPAHRNQAGADLPEFLHLDIRAPRIRRTAGDELTTA